MLGKVIIVNGQKKIQALTADTGTGAPVGSYLYLEKKSNPQGYLYCDGSTFDETAYPALYQYLGTNVLPDWREFSAVGAEQNTTSSVIATHDVFTQGQEKDDQLQSHEHQIKVDNSRLYYINSNASAGGGIACMQGTATTPNLKAGDIMSGRSGDVTRGKRKAVFVYIKATSGLTENQQENVLNTINNNLSYSTEEHPTGAKWIDGKPIYRKVLIVPSNVILDGNTYRSLGVGYPDNAETMFPPIIFNNAANTLLFNSYKPIQAGTLVSGGFTMPAGTEIIIKYTKITD